MWIKDGSIKFSDRGNVGSCIMPDNPDWHLGITKRVECIDFSKWLEKTVKKEDYVIIKMDIEGAEFDVIEKMILDQTIKLVDELHVEFHEQRFRDKYNFYKSRKDKIMRSLIRFKKNGQLILRKES